MNSIEVPDTKVGVLDKAMRILYAFPGGDSSLTPQQIAGTTDMPLPTVYRLAQVLSEHGLLMKVGQRFRLGMTLLRLGSMVAEGLDVRTQSLPHMRWLQEQAGENAELYIRSNESRIPIEVVLSPQNLRVFVEIGTTVPLHVGASGKVLLAWLPESEQTQLIQASAARYPKHPLYDVEALKKSLACVRESGWAVSIDERGEGLSAIAAPIFDVGKEVVGAMAMVAPALRLSAEKQVDSIPLVCEAGRRASLDMGYIADGTR
ncbi:MAG TPA: IclR family transcriptional regulator [Ktedonobacteraceae bacterium]|nr:IclR family transcriptional regulator [Ktedonobacteraceae bacterium]